MVGRLLNTAVTWLDSCLTPAPLPGVLVFVETGDVVHAFVTDGRLVAVMAAYRPALDVRVSYGASIRWAAVDVILAALVIGVVFVLVEVEVL